MLYKLVLLEFVDNFSTWIFCIWERFTCTGYEV